MINANQPALVKRSLGYNNHNRRNTGNNSSSNGNNTLNNLFLEMIEGTLSILSQVPNELSLMTDVKKESSTTEQTHRAKSTQAEHIKKEISTTEQTHRAKLELLMAVGRELSGHEQHSDECALGNKLVTLCQPLWENSVTFSANLKKEDGVSKAFKYLIEESPGNFAAFVSAQENLIEEFENLLKSSGKKALTKVLNNKIKNIRRKQNTSVLNFETLTFKDLVASPFQRAPKYHLFYKDLKKNEPNNSVFTSVSLESMDEFGKKINSALPNNTTSKE